MNSPHPCDPHAPAFTSFEYLCFSITQTTQPFPHQSDPKYNPLSSLFFPYFFLLWWPYQQTLSIDAKLSEKTMEECKCSEDSCECELQMSRLMKSESVRNLHELIEKECGAVERTACQTAAGRALWKHVIHDPVAEILAGETYLRNLYGKMKKDRLNKAREIAGVMLAVRTLWFDSRLEAALRCFEGESQVVLLGAGMDARVYRLTCLKGCTVFEVDLPKVLELKVALLQEAATTTTQGERQPLTFHAKTLCHVPSDLTKKDWFDSLISSGFVPQHNTVWILEGILYYLHDLNAREVLRLISEKCQGSTILLADFMNECSTNLPHELKSNFHFYSDWPEELLPTLGYSQVKVSQIGDSDANFGLLMDPHNCFNKLREVPRYMNMDADGMPCRRLYLVQAIVDQTTSRS
ncbi:hypothetical protein SUGI_0584470 [Cryptomeria japonica]|nr:hypothetical protein SUGI_0584470 [Cryptomeria japonica]